MDLQRIDITNSDDIARQLHLLGSFGEYLSNRPDNLSEESEQTLLDILTVLESYAAELSRILDGQPLDIDRARQSRLAVKTGTSLIDRMLSNDPELLAYSPNTAPKTLSEVVLNFLTHAVVTLSETHTSKMRTE